MTCIDSESPISIGDTYEKWTIIAGPVKNDRGRTCYVAQCECGNTHEFVASQWRYRQSKKCNECGKDRNRRVKINDEYGDWLVIGETKGERDELLWVCMCKCGNTENMRGNKLRGTGRQRCVKCSNKARCSADMMEHYHKKVAANAKNRNLNFPLTVEFLKDLLEQQNYKCALSGLPIQIAANHKEHAEGCTTASLDRVNSDEDYSEHNVQFIHKDLNVMKMDFSQEEFIQMCNNVAATHPLPEDSRVGHAMHCTPPTPTTCRPYGSGFAALQAIIDRQSCSEPCCTPFGSGFATLASLTA